VIDTFHADAKSTLATHTNTKSIASNVHITQTPTPSTHKTYEVNSIQSTPIGKINLKKERVGIRRIEIITRYLKRTKNNLLMIRISINLDIPTFSVVMITTRNIVQDVSRSLSSFK
jgi:hypothetical protein